MYVRLMTENGERFIEVGRAAGAFGVRGWVRVVPFGSGEALESARSWRLVRLNGSVSDVTVSAVERRGAMLIARWDGCDSKEDADRMKGTVSVRRADFPELDEGEFWEADLVGMKAVNRDGVPLGTVTDIGDNGVQDILQVEGDASAGGRPACYLIPLVDAYVDGIDADEGIVRVDWDPSWV